MSFRDEFLKIKQPGPAREQLVYEAAIKLPKQQIISSMRPITIKKPDGTEITFKVMPDYLMIEGMRAPMSGVTAQRVADYFNLKLPTSKMSRDIYQNADVKVSAKPLSGTGTIVDGKRYSGKQVVDTGVGYSDFTTNYNDVINNQLSEAGAKKGQIVSGFAKDVVAPTPGAENKLGLHGFYQDGKPIQGGSGQTPHDPEYHTEYGAYVRLVAPEATIKHPDGRVETVATDDLYNYTRYKDSGTKAQKKSKDRSLTQSISGGALDPLPSGYISVPLNRIGEKDNNLLQSIYSTATKVLRDPNVSFGKFQIINLNGIDFAFRKEIHGPNPSNPKDHLGVSTFFHKSNLDSLGMRGKDTIDQPATAYAPSSKPTTSISWQSLIGAIEEFFT